MQNSLFSVEKPAAPVRFQAKPELSQWFTPEWAASALVERYFSSLSSSDLVIEPSCGLGAFLKAIPGHVSAVGVEIDPDLAEIARKNTGRTIITGDFTSVDLPAEATAIIGNPPYEVELFEMFLLRAHRVLPDLSRCGFLIPAYFFQTFKRVNQWANRWSMQLDLVPRNLFPGIKFPLSFCVFSKDARRDMIGFALYAEAGAVDNLHKEAQKVLRDGRPRKNVWFALVEDTLESLGGRATLNEMYSHIESKRPTETAFWREKIRQTLQRHFERVGRGEWALKHLATA